MNQILPFLGQQHQPYLHAKGKLATMHLLNWLDCQPGEKILEFGVGTGGTLVTVLSRYRQTKFWGVDASDLMVRKTKQRLAFCLLSDLAVINKVEYGKVGQFSDNYFDKIYVESVLGIQTREVLTNLMASFGRLLKPSGQLLLNETIWLESTNTELINQFNEFAIEKFGIRQASADYPYIDNWLSLLSGHQFTILNVEPVDELTPISVNTSLNERLSSLYTLGGTLYGKLFLRKKKKQFEQSFAFNSPGKQLMAGYLIKAENMNY